MTTQGLMITVCQGLLAPYWHQGILVKPKPDARKKLAGLLL